MARPKKKTPITMPATAPSGSCSPSFSLCIASVSMIGAVASLLADDATPEPTSGSSWGCLEEHSANPPTSSSRLERRILLHCRLSLTASGRHEVASFDQFKGWLAAHAANVVLIQPLMGGCSDLISTSK
eukprot:scaffold21244_cov60-Phaeocystis_antarctica.AAC.4